MGSPHGFSKGGGLPLTPRGHRALSPSEPGTEGLRGAKTREEPEARRRQAPSRPPAPHAKPEGTAPEGTAPRSPPALPDGSDAPVTGGGSPAAEPRLLPGAVAAEEEEEEGQSRAEPCAGPAVVASVAGAAPPPAPGAAPKAELCRGGAPATPGRERSRPGGESRHRAEGEAWGQGEE